MKKEDRQNKEEYLSKLKIRWHLGGVAFVIGVTILAFALGDYIDLRLIIIPAWTVLVFYLIKYYYVQWFSNDD